MVFLLFLFVSPVWSAVQCVEGEYFQSGNGTHNTFESDPNVLFFSIHRYDYGGFYPNTPKGAATAVGTDGAEGL